MAIKYAIFSGMVTWSGGKMLLNEGTTIDDDHPFYLERPDLFSDDAPEPNLPGPGRLARRSEVENASARPGQKRATKRG